MLNKLLITLTLGLSLCGCLWDTKTPVAPIAIKDTYYTCDIPDKYFELQSYPTRPPGYWTTQRKESDTIDYILEHRATIDHLNGQLTNIKLIHDNCNTQAQRIK